MEYLEINGKFNTAKLFCKSKIYNAIEQIKTICDDENYKNTKIVVMPDYHVGKGCVIGLTMQFKNPVNPELVGVDIGCGVSAWKLKDICSFNYLDDVIKNQKYTYTKNFIEYKCFYRSILDNLKCPLKNKEYNFNQWGTLGSGNHFIEICKGNDAYYLIVHSGSRYLGVEVASYYTEKFKNNEKDWFDDYIHDLKITQEYAHRNRYLIASGIVDYLGLNVINWFESIHNYIDANNILRKGAISAKKNEKVIIPLNMKDGAIIGIGKNNEDWNFSAPHGAGRILSRSQAKKSLNIDDFKKDMQGIYTTCVNEKTIDESSFAYKTPDEIIDIISPTVDIKEIIKPIYNFKN